MIKVQGNKRFKYMLLIAALVLLPVMLYLGFWQLDRAEEKEQLLSSWKTPSMRELLPDESELVEGQYLGVRLQGRFDETRYFLLDNRMRKGKPGYEIIALFISEGVSQKVLVNLGWLPLGKSREQIPKVLLPQDVVIVSGKLKLLSKNIVLKRTSINEGWPKVVQSLEPVFLSEVVAETLPAFGIHVDRSVIDYLDINWPVLMMLPEKHIGYAVQWFVMSMVLTGMIIWSLSQIKREAYE